jgi:PASTA domain
MRVTRALVFVTTLLLLSACQSSDSASSFEPTASDAAPPTEVSIVPATAAPTTTTPVVVVQVTEVTVDDGVNPFGGNDAEDRLMPSVVCMNLQDAQDEIQDHGVIFSGSEDATGQGRNQFIDSNWQVVGQDPEAGTPIGEFDATLLVVKYGEQPNPC